MMASRGWTLLNNLVSVVLPVTRLDSRKNSVLDVSTCHGKSQWWLLAMMLSWHGLILQLARRLLGVTSEESLDVRRGFIVIRSVGVLK